MKNEPNDREFLKLINENPDLPVFAQVSQEECFCGSNDYRWMMGRFEYAHIEEYIEGKEAIYLKSDIDDPWDVVGDLISDDDAENMSDEEFITHFNNLPWQKAIFVDIGAY